MLKKSDNANLSLEGITPLSTGDFLITLSGGQPKFVILSSSGAPLSTIRSVLGGSSLDEAYSPFDREPITAVPDSQGGFRLTWTNGDTIYSSQFRKTDRTLYEFASTAGAAAMNQAKTVAMFTVIRDGNINTTSHVHFSTVNGGSRLFPVAKAGFDYKATSVDVTFLPGQFRKQVTVPILGDLDHTDESLFSPRSEAFSGVLTAVEPNSVVGNTNKALMELAHPTALVSFNHSFDTPNRVYVLSVSESAGQAIVSFVRSGSTDGAMSVYYHTVNGSAIAGRDYTAVTDVLTFAPKQTTATVKIPLIKDASKDGLRTFIVDVTGVGGPGAGPILFHTLRITINDTTGL